MSIPADGQKRTYKVRIFNQTYSIVSSASEAEFRLIADQVDHLMHTIASRSGSADGVRAAVMAAMHLADRLRQAEKRLESVYTDQREALEQVGEQTDYLERLLRETLELDDSAAEAGGQRRSAGAAASRARGRTERNPAMPTLFAMEQPPADKPLPDG